MPKIIKIGSSL